MGAQEAAQHRHLALGTLRSQVRDEEAAVRRLAYRHPTLVPQRIDSAGEADDAQRCLRHRRHRVGCRRRCGRHKVRALAGTQRVEQLSLGLPGDVGGGLRQSTVSAPGAPARQGIFKTSPPPPLLSLVTARCSLLLGNWSESGIGYLFKNRLKLYALPAFTFALSLYHPLFKLSSS